LRGLAEEIRIVTKVLDGRRSDCIDAILDHKKAGGRKLGDPKGDSSASAGSARLIQPYRSASSAL
jgi:hypothetical protein